MGLFVAAHGWGDLKAPLLTPLPKIPHPLPTTYSTIMKRGTVIPYLKKI